MFTGLIEDMGTVLHLGRVGDAFRLTVAVGGLPTAEIRIGDSIAVNGACLTVVAVEPGRFSADVSPETVACTSLALLKPRAAVNLERALRLSDRLGGHLVYGHVDATAVVAMKRKDGNAVRMEFRLQRDINRYLVAKGSVAIDGISLTVNEVSEEGFSIAVIPHTLEKTTLCLREIGEIVNIEVDIFAKYVERLLGSPAAGGTEGKLTSQFLAEHGFL
jgi:riboflavin synthase